jgi:hypothetical protein
LISVVGCAAAVLIGGPLLWLAIGGGGGRAPRRAATAASVAAMCGVALAAVHAGLALRNSSLVLLFAAPGYAAAAALLGLWWSRRGRGGRAAAAGARVVALGALGALCLLAFSVVREMQLQALRAAAASPPEVRAEELTLDLSAKSWPVAFEALCTDLAARYPFSRWKGIDWRRRCAAATPRIVAVARARDSRGWYRAVRDFAWDIPDGHVGLGGDDHGLEGQEVGGRFGLRVAQLADRRVVVCEVVAGGSAARAGMRFGAEILAWDGQPIERALDRVPVLWAARPPATAETRRAAQLRFLPRAPVGARVNVRFRNRGEAAVVEISLTAVRDRPVPAQGEGVAFGLGEAIAGRAVEWRWLAGEAGQCGASGGGGAGGPVAGRRGASSGSGRSVAGGRAGGALAGGAPGKDVSGSSHGNGGAVGGPCGSSGVGYIRIRYEMPTLWQVDLGAAVEDGLRELAASEAKEAREANGGGGAANGGGAAKGVGAAKGAGMGIVLDVRGNGGGIDAMVPPVLGYFVTGRQVYEIPGVLAAPGGMAGGVGGAGGGGEAGGAVGGFLPLVARTRYVEPRAPRFAGRVAVLIDGETGSAAEGFPLGLRGLPNVAVFGFAGTGGYFAVGQRSIRLPGGLTLRLPVGASLDADRRVQIDSDATGRGGVVPDHRLAWTDATVDAVYRDRRDVALGAAMRWLQTSR